MIRHNASYLILTVALSSAHVAAAETVARWVDANGITHFGDVQLAPPHAELERIGPANAMDAPAVQATGSSATGPSWSLINRPPKQNPKGWRAKGDGVRHGPVSYSR
ncbi:MAG: DUF4124 domain-containing protein [Pseudomonadales bacterium]